MNRYLHAVGLCAGLAAVIVLSAVNGVFIGSGEWLSGLEKPYFTQRAYMLGWLGSYLLTAWCFGEFAINKRLRKLLFIPCLEMIFTAGYFYALFRTKSLIGAIVCLSGGVAAQVPIAVMTAKNSRFTCAAAIADICWYAVMLGLGIATVIINN